MARSLTITVHPSELGAEYLTVSDAMRQVLDLIEALERAETVDADERQIVWRLTDAHTNSPPFTVTAQAFPVNPAVSIALQASHATEVFSSSIRLLLKGNIPDRAEPEVITPLKRVLKRNLNGIGRTAIAIEGEEPIDVVPVNARNAIVALERHELDVQAATPDYRRTEYGTVEVEVRGLTRWNEKPALIAVERLSQDKVTCVLTEELAEHLGPNHKWEEAWAAGRLGRLLVGGALHYGPDGSLKRIDAETVEERPWTEVSLADLKGINILDGRSVSEHLRLIREGDVG